MKYGKSCRNMLGLEMAELVRALDTIIEGLGSVPGTYMVSNIMSVTPIPEDPALSSGLC